MARPLRIDVRDGWYHVAGRGIERRRIFTDRRERSHFLELLGEMVERYSVHVHVYVLMDNHYHLLIQTPEANASRAMHWLNVSYAVWFNRRHERVGPLFQGRFKAVLIDGQGAWALLASAYVHLNPVRVKDLGLDKRGRHAEGLGLRPVSREQAQARLAVLRGHAWSSYPAYAGYTSAPDWLSTQALLGRAGGAVAYRDYLEAYLRQGMPEDKVAALKARLAIGTEAFREKARRLVKGASKEQPDRRELSGPVSVARIVVVVEKVRRERLAAFRDRYGDWGRDLVLYLARKRSGLTLDGIGQAVGGLEYKAVGKAVERFQKRLKKDKALATVTDRCLCLLSHVETRPQ